jgi:hypothetical protein
MTTALTRYIKPLMPRVQDSYCYLPSHAYLTMLLSKILMRIREVTTLV